MGKIDQTGDIVAPPLIQVVFHVFAQNFAAVKALKDDWFRPGHHKIYFGVDIFPCDGAHGSIDDGRGDSFRRGQRS